MLQELKRRYCILEFGVINNGKAQISRPRPRYENNIKVDFVAIGGDDVSWTHFKRDIKKFWKTSTTKINCWFP
jgi:hypothetical protein